MLAYAANRRVVVDRRPHPNVMLVIIGAHVAAVAALMSAKMDLPRGILDKPTVIEFIKVPPAPPANTPPTRSTTPPTRTAIDQPIREATLPPIDQPIVGLSPPTIQPGPIVGAGATVTPVIPNREVTLATSGPQLLTPESDRKPPYPASKLLNEEEAVLTLRLTIDDRGRVVAVDPIGRADMAFLEAARRHLTAHWRYKPAMEAGRAVTSSMVIRLRFELDG